MCVCVCPTYSDVMFCWSITLLRSNWGHGLLDERERERGGGENPVACSVRIHGDDIHVISMGKQPTDQCLPIHAYYVHV